MFTSETYARDGSKTRRKELRRDVRAALGTSRDDAPSLAEILRAADALRAMIDLASSGRFGLALYDFEDPYKVLPIDEGRRILREAQEDHSYRLGK